MRKTLQVSRSYLLSAKQYNIVTLDGERSGIDFIVTRGKADQDMAAPCLTMRLHCHDCKGGNPSYRDIGTESQPLRNSCSDTQTGKGSRTIDDGNRVEIGDSKPLFLQ